MQPFTSQSRASISSSEVADLELLVEQIWRDLKGDALRTRIQQVVIEVAASFDYATVKAYVPLFIRRVTLQRLRAEVRVETQSLIQ